MTRRQRYWLIGGVLGAVSLVLLALLAWFLAAPLGAVANISREDVEGEWTLDSPHDHSFALNFTGDGVLRSSDWLTELGCPTWPDHLTLDTIDWTQRSEWVGTWDDRLGGSQLRVWPSDHGECRVPPFLTMERNYLTGDLRMYLYIDGFQQEDEYLRFVKEVDP